MNRFNIGYVGLGKMGSNMVERLCEVGHTVSAYDPSESARQSIENIKEATAFDNYNDMVNALPAERKIIWLMVPSNIITSLIKDLSPLLSPGDLVIDGGNTNFNHTIDHAKQLEAAGINFMDIGVSGGPGGARSGACMMIGGKESDFRDIEDLFKGLCVPDGYQYLGQNGSGHFVKMIHNGIEYGMMQAIAEGFNLLKQSDFDLDVTKIAHVYNNGSVIESSLINWLYQGYVQYGINLDEISGTISHSGEGQWTIEYADRIGQPVDNIRQSLQFRINSTHKPSYTGKVVSVLRNMFGGHKVSNN